MCVLEAIAGRRSIRSYSDKPVREADIITVLKAAMAAPSARNVQPWLFYVVRDREILKNLGDRLPYARMASGAPVAIVVCGDITKGNPREEQKLNWAIDCSAATQNLLLAAHALGLGAVWTGVFPYPDRIEVARDLLDLSEQVVPLCVIPMGYPAEEPGPKEKWDPDKVTWR